MSVTAVKSGAIHPKQQTWDRRLAKRRREGKCCCWDCLRGDGLTPPLGVRHSHPQLHPTREVGWVAGFELKGEDREMTRSMLVPPRQVGKGGTGRFLILAEHRNKSLDNPLLNNYVVR